MLSERKRDEIKIKFENSLNPSPSAFGFDLLTIKPSHFINYSNLDTIRIQKKFKMNQVKIHKNYDNDNDTLTTMMLLTASEQNILSGDWYQKREENDFNNLSATTYDAFKHLYDESVTEGIKKNAKLFKYFDEKTMNTVKPGTYSSFKKLFSLSNRLSSILVEKKVKETNLLTKLNITSNQILDNKSLILNSLKNYKTEDFFSITRDIQECNKMLEQNRNLTQTIWTDEESSLTEEDEINLASIFLPNDQKIDFNISKNEIQAISDASTDIAHKLAIKENERLILKADKANNLKTIKYIDAQIELNDEIKENCESDIRQLLKNLSASSERQQVILNSINDEQKLEEFLKENLKKKNQLNEVFAKSLLENQNTKSDVAGIKNLKFVKKNYHIIFALDNSGSMTDEFGSVLNSVNAILEKRKKLPVSNDTVSVIKFNSEANIEYLNAKIKETISIENECGGGTSFVKALQKINDILGKTNEEMFTPIIFFLSDGEGESLNVVLNKCHSVKNEFSTMNLLFFTVGYGNKADSKCLEERCLTMARLY